MQKLIFIFLMYGFLGHCSARAQNMNYNGKWEYVKYSDKDKKNPETVFTIYLEVNKNNVKGWHCSVMHNGGKIDCSDDKTVESIVGQIKGDTLYCKFKSFFSDSNNVGRAVMYLKKNNLLGWRITSSPKEKYYVPLNCFLQKIDEDISQDVQISSHNVVLYNERAYQFEQAGKYQEAVDILVKVIQADPSRVVAYLNIADAYWGLNDRTRAKENYNKYIDLMKTRQKDLSRIPKRVYDRVK